jgi:hypothetical protein
LIGQTIADKMLFMVAEMERERWASASSGARPSTTPASRSASLW